MVSVPSRGILFPNSAFANYMLDVVSFRPLSGYLISKYCFKFFNHVIYRFRPLSGYLISKYYRCKEKEEQKCFRPLSGYLISKFCPPEPAILLAFLTLLRGKSFSCIFFLYLNIHNRLQMQYLCGARQNYLFF